MFSIFVTTTVMLICLLLSFSERNNAAHIRVTQPANGSSVLSSYLSVQFEVTLSALEPTHDYQVAK